MVDFAALRSLVHPTVIAQPVGWMSRVDERSEVHHVGWMSEAKSTKVRRHKASR
ncbi:MAG: hypothetical protein N2690_05985 [Rhodocyclaceae bacterium]|nr:hypothetical protein [Rhodocyclaceae bacterium]